MTRIAFCSDLHLENHGRNFEFPDADVLLLAGDICVVEDLCDAFAETQFGYNQRQFFIDAAAKYKSIIWIPGNHELWSGCIDTLVGKVNDFLSTEGLSNIIFAPTGSHKVNDIQLVFATLWTDINKANPIDVSGSGVMNDYRHIMVYDDSLESGVRYLTPQDTMAIHCDHREFISTEVQGHEKVVVMTHHAPHMLSSGGHSTDKSSVFYCCTDMEDVILDNPQIKLWVAGHTHHKTDYIIGDVRILSNPRGYRLEKLSHNFVIETIDL